MNKIIYLIPLTYLLGSIPFAYLTVRVIYKKNIYRVGSGNGGTTNVYRNFGFKAALFVFICDFTKGFLPLLILRAGLIKGDDILSIILVLAAVVGHTFPIWTHFKGGKGVAVGAGGVSGTLPFIAPFSLVTFILTVAISGYISLGSLLSAMTLPLYFYLYNIFWPTDDFWVVETFLILLSSFVVFAHRKNIHRIREGEEEKLFHKRAKRD